MDQLEVSPGDGAMEEGIVPGGAEAVFFGGDGVAAAGGVAFAVEGFLEEEGELRVAAGVDVEAWGCEGGGKEVFCEQEVATEEGPC